MTTAREQEIESRAATILRGAGFPYVQEQPRVASVGRPIHADLLVWDVNVFGVLAPRFVVEVKARRRSPDAAILHQVASYANALGVREAYFFNGEDWFAFDPSFGGAAPTEAPQPAARELLHPLPSALIRDAVVGEAFRAIDAARSRGLSPSDYPGVTLERLRELQDQGEVSLGRFLLDPQARLVAAQTVLEDVLPRAGQRAGDPLERTPWPVAQALARLLDPHDGDVVLDPSCHRGMTLLAAAASTTSSLRLIGIDPQHAAIEFARELFTLAGVAVELQVGRPLEDGPLPEADRLVCAPPFGVRRHEPAAIATGEATLDGDLVQIDRLLTALRPGGRASLLVLPKVLFAGGAWVRLREHIQRTFWVAAIVSLPRGVLQPATMVAPVLLVLQRTAPQPTLVADLGDDWQAQLATDGDFMRAYRGHMEGR